MPVPGPRAESPDPDFRLLFESLPGLYVVLDPALTIVAASEAYLLASMRPREELLGRSVFEAFPDNPGDPGATGVANLRESLQRVLSSRQPDAMAVQQYDIQCPASEGGGFEKRYWSPINSPVLSAEGEVRFIIQRVEDVTEFIRLKEAHRTQGALAEELRGQAARMEREVFQRAQEIQVANRQLRDLQADLERRVEARTAELQQANEALLRTEAQLRQAQKMEAIGQLAGGIAHDFNNLLTVISSASEVMVMRLGANPHLAAIRQASERAEGLTRQLLAFSRQQILAPQALDLNEAIRGLSPILERLLGEDIKVRTLGPPGLRRVFADPSQIEQVILNLAINARDAMPEGGTLTLETANVDLSAEDSVSHLGSVPGPHVLLAVSDTGHGMDRATQERVFEPFFTTKARGKGTGLGLATVFGVVKQSRGHISLHSEPGRGTTFRLYFAGLSPEDCPHAGGESVEVADVGGTETILLVEDEDLVREVAGDTLREAGYTVLEARNGEEALALCSRHGSRIDLLLSDVIMPGMNGRQVFELASSLHPKLAILFMSGYTDDAVLRHGVLVASIPFLQKPFTPSKLRVKVREAIARAGLGS